MAIPVIARLIASKGVREAIKKYGKPAVDEARKHMKDMKTKPTTGQTATSKATKGQRTYRSGQRKAGTVGAAAGYGASESSKEKPKATTSKPKAAPAKLPLAKEGTPIDVRGDSKGMRY
jgi:hypothetical protein